MGAYTCQVCDNMFDSHVVNFYACDKCGKQFCEDCWIDSLDENQDWGTADLCGDCYFKRKSLNPSLP